MHFHEAQGQEKGGAREAQAIPHQALHVDNHIVQGGLLGLE